MKRLLLLIAAFLPTGPVSAQYNIYWGDVHGHTAHSDGKGSVDEYFTYARDVSHSDFVIISDHDFGNAAPWRLSRETWQMTQEKADQYTVNGKFIAIAGFEWTSQPKYWTGVAEGEESERLFPGSPQFYNHKNVYFPHKVDDIFRAKDVAYMTPDLLAEAVRKAGGLSHNNHPSAGPDGRDQWDYTAASSEVIVNTEMYGDVLHYEGKTYEVNMEKAVCEFLGRGGKTGFVRGTDTHEGKPEAHTAIVARELTRESLFESLRHRRNYAVSHARIGLEFTLNGHWMGEECEIEGQPRLSIKVYGTDIVKKVEIIRDGDILQSISPEKNSVEWTYTDDAFGGQSYYYVRVTQLDKDQYDNPSRAWSSPIWVREKR